MIDNDALAKLFNASHYSMINVNKKRNTYRRALAVGTIFVGKDVFDLIKEKRLPKGDAIALAEIGGIIGAKQVSTNIPLCHPLSLDQVSVVCELNESEHSITVYCLVCAYAKTGVEMEALAGVNNALLVIYDLSKMIHSDLEIGQIRLLFKEGGKQSLWCCDKELPSHLKSLILKDKAPLLDKQIYLMTCSDRASQGEYKDVSGIVLKDMLTAQGADIIGQQVIADDADAIRRTLQQALMNHNLDLIICSGGTGLSKRDVTPDVFREVCDREVIGISELLRHEGAAYTRYSWLSRIFVGQYKQVLIIALPGSPKAVKECLEILLDKILEHALAVISGDQYAQLSRVPEHH